MNRKQKALKALAVLAVVIALCMFFSRTVQTITTPKVQRISATKGKLEQKIAVTGALYFDQTTPYKVVNAQKLAITIDQVNVRAGYYVEKGASLFTASAPEYDAKMKELSDKYVEAVEKASDKYVENIRLTQTSRQNDAYTALLQAEQAFYDARYALLSAASAAGFALPGDEAQWGAVTGGGETVVAASARFKQAGAARDAANKTLQDIYESKYRISNGTFSYIKEIEGLYRDVNEAQEEMLAFESLARSLTSVTAPQSGYITALDVKEGDEYNGAKAAFTMSAEGALPVLRLDITNVDKTIQTGMKAEIGANGVSGEVKEVTASGDGKKYAVIALDERTITAMGGMTRLMSETDIEATLIYKAQKSSTLLPASAVRSDGDGAYYVYIVERSRGGILDSSRYVLSKTTVNVLEKSDQVVSLSDDLSYREIADREDRALKEGQAVMDYVD